MTVVAASTPVARRERASLSRVVAAGIAGGTVDFVYATTVGLLAGRSIIRVWQGVAGGWQGKAALDGGLGSFALGVATHFSIAIAMAGAYALAATRLPILYRRPLLMAPVYGLILYGVMYGVVLPLRWPEVFPRWSGGESVLDIVAHIGVALAIVLVLSQRTRVR